MTTNAPSTEQIMIPGEMLIEPGDIEINVGRAGTAVRFEPGQVRTVELVALAGARVVYGFRGLVMGKLDG